MESRRDNKDSFVFDYDKPKYLLWKESTSGLQQFLYINSTVQFVFFSLVQPVSQEKFPLVPKITEAHSVYFGQW